MITKKAVSNALVWRLVQLFGVLLCRFEVIDGFDLFDYFGGGGDGVDYFVFVFVCHGGFVES